MIKIFFIIVLTLFFYNPVFAENYYFKNCKLGKNVYANYKLELNNKIIKVNIRTSDGKQQEFIDKIKSIEKSKIISDKIKSGKSTDSYFVYYLDSDSHTVVKQDYQKDEGIDLIRPVGPAKKSFCADVKAGWKLDKNKQDEKNEKKLFKVDTSTPKCEGSDFKSWNNCNGTHTTSDGFKYTGLFINGKIFEGQAIYPGGAKYVGAFKNNKPHGYGAFSFPDGSEHFGEWKNGKANGQGIKTWKNGKKYNGNFENDKPQGKGTIIYPNGSKYVGEFKNGKQHGKGTLTNPDGSAYLGQFIDGEKHGLGTCFDSDGSTIKCTMDIKTTGRNTKNISIDAKKWIKLSQYESNSGKGKKTIDKLNLEFVEQANALCSAYSKYDTLEKSIIITELDETPAYGLETVIKLGIRGVVECK